MASIDINNAVTKSKLLDLDEVMNEIGQSGRFQIINFSLIVIPMIFAAMSNANFVFVTKEPEYRCRVPQCDDNTTLSELKPSWLPDGDYKCDMPVFSTEDGDNIVCDSESYTNTTIKCNEWVYDDEDSLVETLNIPCSPFKRSLIGTMHYAGMVLSMPLMGFAADKYGRKLGFIVSAVGVGVVGVTKTLVKNYNLYLIVEFLEAAIGASASTNGFVLMLELGGRKSRFIMASLCGFAIAFGETAFGVIAYYVHNYKKLIAVIYVPSILMLTYSYFLTESIRWLLSTGRRLKARDTILYAAKCNRRELSKELLDKLENIETIKLNENEGNANTKVNYKELVTSKIIMSRLLIAMVWWFSADLVYYGFLIGSVSLPGNEYFNFVLTAVISVPGDILVLLLLNRCGRKFTIIMSFFLCGIFTLARSFVPGDQNWLSLTLFLLGKMLIATAYSSIFTYASELFPTEVRSLLVGFSSMFAGIGSILAPLSPLLGHIMPQMPSFIFAGLALISGFLAFFTPETLNTKLPDTIKEVEDAKLKKDLENQA